MRTIIISGASSGIGLACAQKFLEHDYFVCNFDLVDNEHLQNNARYAWFEVDVRHKEQIIEAVSKVVIGHSKIDALVVSAGKHVSATIENTSDEQLLELIQLNILGAFWLIQAVVPNMKEHLSGNIITIGSDQSSVAKYNSAAYGMTKTALASLTKSVALDYAKYNIQSNCICAGTIDTPLYRKAIANYSKASGIPLDEIEKMEAQEQPIGRIGLPEEIAELAYFLNQGNTKFITGALIPIDGGYTAK